MVLQQIPLSSLRGVKKINGKAFRLGTESRVSVFPRKRKSNMSDV
jgi:hypothetical protein